MLTVFKMVKNKSTAKAPIAASPYASARKAKGSVQIVTQDPPKRTCLCKIMGLQGNLAALLFEKAPGDNAFHNPLKLAMEADCLKDDGFILLTNRRISSSKKKTLRHVYSGLTYQDARLNSGFPLPVQASVGLGRARGWHYSSPYPPEPMYRLRI